VLHVLHAHTFEPRLLSVPFAVAFATVLVVSAYALVVRAAPVLRATLLVYATSLLPYVGATTLSASTVDPEVALLLQRIAVSSVPLVAAGAMGFQLALAGKFLEWRWLVAIALITGLGWIAVGVGTDLGVSAVRLLPSGIYYFVPGPVLPLGAVAIAVWSAAGFIPLARAYRREPDSARRRQMRSMLWSMGISWSGMVDVPIAYGVGGFPLGWALITAGAVFALRALFIDDLLRPRAIDTRAPTVVVYLVGATLVGWLVADLVARGLPWWLGALVVVGSHVILRGLIAAVAAMGRPERRGGPLERLLSQFSTRAGQMRTASEIAALTIDTVELAVGARPTMILPAVEDWGWRRPDGEPVSEAQTPDPLLLGWMLEHGRPILREELDLIRLDDLGPALRALFDGHQASVLVPLISRDDVVGMLVLRGDPPPVLRQSELEFLERLDDRVAGALVYARMARQARLRVAIEREVELAASLQLGFVPPPVLHEMGAVAVMGSWEPASQCGGDWWSLHKLSRGRVLIGIGDVTGHGVAAAMVTAAAKGATEAAVRLHGDDLDLIALMGRLDAAVRRVGAGKLHLTCFLTLIDPEAGEVRFVNAGHVVPYVVRDAGKPELDIHALVARGNPLGAGANPVTRSAVRRIEPGDLLVWYTDGLVEGNDTQGDQFGDRRMQRVLRRLDRTRLDPETVHDAIAGAASAHRAGRRHADDMTLVVARMRPVEAA
jgi:serine phosphatase RsbU (regulator of sigma subunit)